MRKYLKIDWKKALSTSGLLFLILQLVPVYANESFIETQMDQEQSKQQSKKENPQQNKLSQDKQKYSFLTNQSIANTPNQITKKSSSTNDALSVSIGLVVILVMIFSLAWFMKKMGYTNVTGQGKLKIIASLNLGQKEKIALIQVGKQQLLVGMTATQINTLHVLDEFIEESDIKQVGVTGDGAFANKFSELLKHKQGNVK